MSFNPETVITDASPPCPSMMSFSLSLSSVLHIYSFPLGTRGCYDVESTSMIQRRNNVVCPVGCVYSPKKTHSR